MGRPKSGRNVKDVTLTLTQENIKAGRRRAFQHGISLSELVDRLLNAEMSGAKSIAAQFSRKLLKEASSR